MARETRSEEIDVTGEDRLTVNAEPLKVVETRAGEPAAPPGLVLAIKRSKTARLQRVSVHRDHCQKLPAPGAPDWAVTPASQDQISRMLETADKARIPTSVSCPSCGGWTSVA